MQELSASGNSPKLVMRRWLPRTMTGMVSAGCLLAALPLLASLLLAGGALDRLTRDTDTLVRQGIHTADLGAQLRDQVRDLARNAEQYVALRDPALLDVIGQRQRDATATLAQLAALGPLEETGRMRQELLDARRAWAAALAAEAPTEDALLRFRVLAPEADRILEAGRRTIARQVEEVAHATSGAHVVIALSALALIPLTALLTLGFSLAVTHPLRALRQSIFALGHGHYGQPIAITYPEEMRELGERLDWLRRRAQALEEEKDRFLRHVSHELKTPLATLQEGSALLREQALGPLSRRQQEVALILTDAATELGTLIGNLLAYAEWVQESRRPEASWFEIEPLVGEIALAHRLSLSRRGLSVTLVGGAARLHGQRTRLRVALDNLVGNAIKHAPAGTAIQISARRADGRCELCVRDSGTGVAEPERLRIFEPFVRGADPVEGGARGTGIGLSIVRETARAHEGTVEVEDAHPGARFRMVWPCPAVAEP